MVAALGIFGLHGIELVKAVNLHVLKAHLACIIAVHKLGIETEGKQSLKMVLAMETRLKLSEPCAKNPKLHGTWNATLHGEFLVVFLRLRAYFKNVSSLLILYLHTSTEKNL